MGDAYHLQTPASEWSVSGSASNATNNQSKAAAAGYSHYITKVSASFSAAPAAFATLNMTDGATVVSRNYVAADYVEVNFVPPLKCAANSSFGATLGASGTVGVVGTVNIYGYSRPAPT